MQTEIQIFKTKAQHRRISQATNDLDTTQNGAHVKPYAQHRCSKNKFHRRHPSELHQITFFYVKLKRIIDSSVTLTSSKTSIEEILSNRVTFQLRPYLIYILQLYQKQKVRKLYPNICHALQPDVQSQKQPTTATKHTQPAQATICNPAYRAIWVPTYTTNLIHCIYWFFGGTRTLK